MVPLDSGSVADISQITKEKFLKFEFHIIAEFELYKNANQKILNIPRFPKIPNQETGAIVHSG